MDRRLIVRVLGIVGATACSTPAQRPVYASDDPCLEVAIRVELGAKVLHGDAACAAGAVIEYEPGWPAPRATAGPACGVSPEEVATWKAKFVERFPADRAYRC